MKRTLIRGALVCAVAVTTLTALAVAVYLYLNAPGNDGTLQGAAPSGTAPATVMEGAPDIGGAFTLTDDTGRVVTEQTLVGDKYHLIFFGFADCPDICPGMLTTMAGVYEAMPEAARNRVQMVFVSVDPEKDSAGKLHTFVTGFNSTFEGWVGTRAEVDAMTKSYLAYAARRADPHADGGYTMDHSSLLYLMGPDGKYVTHMRNSDSATSIRERLEKILQST